MGQPLPPGDNVPLYEGLDASWNDIVGALPEDKRAELAPKLKERVSTYENQIQSYKPWEDIQKSGVTPDHASTALTLFSTIENNPREVYETLGKYLNITPAQAKEVVKEIEEGDEDDPRIKKLQEQVDTMAQLMVAQNQQSTQAQMVKEQEQALDKEIKDVMTKYGDSVPEDQILMRMLHKGMTAEQAYQEASEMIAQIRSTRSAPMIMGSGGAIPARQIDVTKLDSKSTKSVVAQMLDHANSLNK